MPRRERHRPRDCPRESGIDGRGEHAPRHARAHVSIEPWQGEDEADEAEARHHTENSRFGFPQPVNVPRQIEREIQVPFFRDRS